MDRRWLVWITVAALYLQRVDPVLVYRVAWTDDGAVPVGHEDIIAIFETVRARSIANALLALFEFLEQAEVAWNLCHGRICWMRSDVMVGMDVE